METVLVELEDICMDEQFFSINFFEMEQIDPAAQDAKKNKKVRFSNIKLCLQDTGR